MSEDSIKGITELHAKLTAFMQANRKATAGALYQVGSEIMLQAKELTPVDLGNLRRSGRVQMPVDTPDGISVQLTFGDEASDYAAAVHYDLDARHDDGQALYLEEPFMQAAGTFAARVADIVKERTGA